METLQRDDLKRLLDTHEPLYLINVLGRDAFRQAHIAGSHNVPLANKSFLSEVEQLVEDKNAKVVMYCASFDCTASPTAAKQLDQAGFTHVLDYEGGMQDWQDGGYPIEQGD